MTRTSLAAFAVATAMLWMCVFAAAQSMAATDEARLGWFLPIARAAWPDSPCTGREQVTLHADATVDELGADPRTVGLALEGTCQAFVVDGLDPYIFCVVLTHELGHLAGRAHDDTPGSAMNPSVSMSYAPCLGAVAHAHNAGRLAWLRSHPR